MNDKTEKLFQTFSFWKQHHFSFQFRDEQLCVSHLQCISTRAKEALQQTSSHTSPLRAVSSFPSFPPCRAAASMFWTRRCATTTLGDALLLKGAPSHATMSYP